MMMCVQGGAEKLVVGADYINLIWVPDTFFVNEKVARFHAATQVTNTRQYFTITLHFLFQISQHTKMNQTN